MLLNECYEALGGDYETTKNRIPTDAMIEKFIIKFVSEGSYSKLCEDLDNKNYSEAFRAAHSLKGVAANLGFDRLVKSVSEITELLRNKSDDEVDLDKVNEVFEVVKEDYNITINAIKAYANI